MNGRCLPWTNVHHGLHFVPLLLIRTIARALQLGLNAHAAVTFGCQ